MGNFYFFDQNNSGGSFVVNDKLCNRLVIEAETCDEAINKSLELGCYYNGVDEGLDCDCCGDRWGSPYEEKNLKGVIYNPKVYMRDHIDDEVYSEDQGHFENIWFNKYGVYKIEKYPMWEKLYGSNIFVGSISFRTMEDYCQFLADEYGSTTPDTRIFYLDGKIKEFERRDDYYFSRYERKKILLEICN